MKPPAHLTDCRYLGDCVYAGRDGTTVVLWLECVPGIYGPNTIALDSRVQRSLEAYMAADHRLQGEKKGA